LATAVQSLRSPWSFRLRQSALAAITGLREQAARDHVNPLCVYDRWTGLMTVADPRGWGSIVDKLGKLGIEGSGKINVPGVGSGVGGFGGVVGGRPGFGLPGYGTTGGLDLGGILRGNEDDIAGLPSIGGLLVGMGNPIRGVLVGLGAGSDLVECDACLGEPSSILAGTRRSRVAASWWCVDPVQETDQPTLSELRIVLAGIRIPYAGIRLVLKFSSFRG
jgi:hypothetical protein